MKPTTPTGAQARYCPDCGDRYWSHGAHLERCMGPREQPCDCPPGWQHQPDCENVTQHTEEDTAE